MTMTAATKALFSMAAPAGGGGGFIIEDTFTEGSDTNIASHTPDTDSVGGGWTDGDGTWDVIASTDVVQETTGGGNTEATIDAGVEDYTLTCTVSFLRGTAAARWQGLVMRSDGAGNYLFVAARNDATSGDLVIGSRGADASIYATFSGIITGGFDGKTVRIRVVMSGNSITVQAPDGEFSDQSHTLTSTAATEYGAGCGHTRVGIRSHNDPGGAWDNFEVEA